MTNNEGLALAAEVLRILRQPGLGLSLTGLAAVLQHRNGESVDLMKLAAVLQRLERAGHLQRMLGGYVAVDLGGVQLA